MQFIKNRLLLGLPDGEVAYTLTKAVERLYNTQCLGTAALAINAGSAATWKMTNASPLPYSIGGILAIKTAATAQAVPTAITWAAVASTFNAGGFLIGLDSAGTITTYPSNVTSATSQALAVAGVVFPTVPEGVCVIGGLLISNSAANTAFTGATTALDAANIAVNYINTTGPFFPIPPV